MIPQHFIHGSTATPDNIDDFSLKLFDYKNDRNNDPDNEWVNNGADAFGPGIYAFSVTPGEGVCDADLGIVEHYGRGKNGQGSTMGFHLKDEELPLANEQAPDAIPVHEWIAVVNDFMTRLRADIGYDPDLAEALAYRLKSQWDDDLEPPTQEDLSRLGMLLGGVALHEIDPEDYDDPEQWCETIIELRDVYDPAAYIDERGGAEELVDQAIESSENLWDVVKHVYIDVATVSARGGMASFNDTFQKAVFSQVSDTDLISVAQVDDDNFYVIFNTPNIELDMIKQTRLNIHEPDYDRFIDGLFKIHEDYGDVLENDQLGLKINALGKSMFAQTFEPKTLRLLQITSCPEAVFPKLIQEIKSQMGTLNEQLWECSPGHSQHYELTKNTEKPAGSREFNGAPRR
jgi:hypothetical protein